MDTAIDGVTRTRRRVVGALLGSLLTAGCATTGDTGGSGGATAAETESSTRTASGTPTASETQTPTGTPTATATPTPRDTITYVIRIDLVPVTLSDEEREHVDPLSLESLPAEERRVVREAADVDGAFSVSYGRGQTRPEVTGLSSLIDRVLARLNYQERTYERENPTATAANPPSYVSAVYVRYEGHLYCLDVVDGDQKYYHCPGD